MNQTTDSSTPPFGCPICASQGPWPLVGKESTSKGTVAVRRCGQCGLHITWPRLESPQEPYFTVNEDAWQKKYGEIDRGALRHDRHQNYLEEVDIISKYISHGRLLDIGCNAGWLLGYLRATKRYELEGAEPGQLLARIAARRTGAHIHPCIIQEIVGRDGAYDGATATDVIEHIVPEEIREFLLTILRLLKPGGYFFLRTPNVKFTALKVKIVRLLPAFLRRKVLMSEECWDAKEHVILWSADSLAKLARALGFEVVRSFVPKPIETRGSPVGAQILRKVLYRIARLCGGSRSVPFFAQDVFLILRRPQGALEGTSSDQEQFYRVAAR